MPIHIDKTSARIAEQVCMKMNALEIEVTEHTSGGDLRLHFNKRDHAVIDEVVSVADVKAFAQEIVDYCVRIEGRRASA